ncbi:MAG: hypothetical protein WA419_19640 [Silvibacterium sp.]
MRLIPLSNPRALFFLVTIVVLFIGARGRLPAQRISASVEVATLPDAPQSQVLPDPSDARQVPPRKGCPPTSPPTGGPAGAPRTATPPKNTGCGRKFDYFYPLGKPPKTGPLSSRDKLRIAASNVVDPFNLITIGATAAITIGSDPDTGYGPGMKGWAKNSGTLLTEDMSGAFFVTYLVPSLTRQDPRYYRMPNGSIPRRILNVLVQPIWTRSDSGKHMLNYGNLIGVPATITLANVYVPGRKQGVGPTAESSAITIASSPIDNLVTEFLPDVAKHIKIRIVLIQRIVNHIALTSGQS